MQFKFKIRFEDDTEEFSHNEKWEQVKDHAHFLPPHFDKKWKQYYLIGDNGFTVATDFTNGTFLVNGTTVHPAGFDGDILTNRKVEYTPIYGRRNFRGDLGELVMPFCGWKANIGGKHYKKVIYILPTCEVIFE